MLPPLFFLLSFFFSLNFAQKVKRHEKRKNEGTCKSVHTDRKTDRQTQTQKHSHTHTHTHTHTNTHTCVRTHTHARAHTHTHTHPHTQTNFDSGSGGREAPKNEAVSGRWFSACSSKRLFSETVCIRFLMHYVFIF